MIRVSLPGAEVAFSTREGGVSGGPYRSLNLGILTDDDPAHVTENRRILTSRLGLDEASVAMGIQVHGAEVQEWDEPPRDGGFARPGAPLPEVDAHTTTHPGVGLLVLAADCLPVALAGGGRVAMAHCGWRGLAAGIVENVARLFDEPPAAVIGPGIGPCCYEVGEEVLAAFADVEGAASGHMLDLPAVARARLAAAGVEAVEHVDLCTSCRPDLFFSHRRTGGVTGRQGGIAWLS
ncbi:MAG TPA: polyphenol oxidase family protein [Thermoleophilaceae bacterium]|nr:polyphenol oxidase family protein [Thermoleophilaceae bacterium]